MSSYKDFEDEDGKVDWNAYRQHQIDIGDTCQTCGAYIIFNRGSIAQDCVSCKSIKTSDDEVDHDKHVRCPNCRHTWDPSDCDDYKMFADGEHSAWCSECDHQFEISTHVSYSFTSPPMEKEKADVRED